MKRRILLILTCFMLVTAMLVTTVACGKKESGESDSEKGSDNVTETQNNDSSVNTENTEDSDDVTDVQNTEEESDEDESTDVQEEYNTEPEDLGGFQLDILTVKEKQWQMHTDIAPVAITGETINRAVFQRNNLVQRLYNAKIVAHEDADYYGMSERISKDLISQEYKYDAAYSEGSSVVSLITQDSLYNLYELPEIQLDESWWSQL